jgi:hypothetical protein
MKQRNMVKYADLLAPLLLVLLWFIIWSVLNHDLGISLLKHLTLLK